PSRVPLGPSLWPHQSLLGSGAYAEGRRVAGFAFDSGPVHLPVWESRDHEQVIFDPFSEVFYCTSPDRRHTRVLSAAHHPSRRIVLMRVVREFVMSDSWTNRRFVLHAGACELANSAVIIAGPQGAGKTTLLMYALGCAGARFIANDRVVVSFDGPEPIVRAMPTVVSIRSDTLDRFPAFEQRWSSSQYNERMALGEAPVDGALAARTDPINLTPAQFSALLRVPVRSHGVARVLLFPRLTNEEKGMQVQPLSPDAAAQRLAASIFAAGSPCKISQVFALPGHSATPDPGVVEELSRLLVGRLNCFECQLGRTTPHTAEAIADALSALLPAAPAPSLVRASEQRS